MTESGLELAIWPVDGAVKGRCTVALRDARQYVRIGFLTPADAERRIAAYRSFGVPIVDYRSTPTPDPEPEIAP
jgi:hypothetical protein